MVNNESNLEGFAAYFVTMCLAASIALETLSCREQTMITYYQGCTLWSFKKL